MNIINKKNKPIKSLSDWKKEIPKKDWVEGRSAFSLANFIINENGLELVKDTLKDILKDEIIFEKGIPEYEVKFDKFGGRGRYHDLGIWGKTKSTNKSFFIGIESKVDETFGKTVSEAYISGITKKLNKKNTKKPQRVEKLLEQNFGNKIKSKHFDLRYQLLYATMGTLEEKADISICFIIVFKTDSYDKYKGKENYRDYCQFIHNVVSEKTPCLIDKMEVNQLTIDGRKLYIVYSEIDTN